MYDRNVRNHAPALVQGRRISEIVVPIAHTAHERSESAAVMLAQTWQLPIRLVHPNSSEPLSHSALENYAQRLSRRYPLQEFTVRQPVGEIGRKSVAPSLRKGSLVFMTTQAANEWWADGSNGREVLKDGGSPLLTMGPHAELQTLDGEIVVALNALTSADVTLGLAKGFSEVHGNRIWLVNVDRDRNQNSYQPKQAELGRYMKRQAAELAHVANVGWEIISSNDTVSAIETFAIERNACLIIAGANNQAGSGRHPIGSTTIGLVSRARQPVLTA